MTKAEIRTLTLNLADVGGENYILNSQTTLLDELIERRLKLFSIQTRCLYDDKISMTLTVGTDQYTMDSTTVFGRPLIDVTRVMINGSYIPRATTLDMPRINSGYLLVAGALPKVWFTHPQRLMLYPKPDAAYDDCYVSGWFYQPAFSADSTESDIPDEYSELACRFIAESLVETAARKKPELLAVYDHMRIQNKMEMDSLRNRMDRHFNAVIHKSGGKNPVRSIS
jgi:hypothetical protein